jgi:hypothetical protein
MAAFAARRLRSCQYRTGPDEAGRNGRASLLDGSRRLLRARPTTLPSIPRRYPGQQKLLQIRRVTARINQKGREPIRGMSAAKPAPDN